MSSLVIAIWIYLRLMARLMLIEGPRLSLDRRPERWQVSETTSTRFKTSTKKSASHSQEG